MRIGFMGYSGQFWALCLVRWESTEAIVSSSGDSPMDLKSYRDSGVEGASKLVWRLEGKNRLDSIEMGWRTGVRESRCGAQ